MDYNYKVYRLINGDETTEFTDGMAFRDKVMNVILGYSRVEVHIREGGDNDLIVEVL